METTIEQTVTEKAVAGPQSLKFSNVTMYVIGGFGAQRTTCKELEIESPVKYAQYNDAIKLTYLEPRKRRSMGQILSGSSKYIVVVPTSCAIDPADPLSAPEQGEGYTTQRSRHTSFHPAYEAEFNQLLAEKKVPILFEQRDTAEAVALRCDAWEKRMGR